MHMWWSRYEFCFDGSSIVYWSLCSIYLLALHILQDNAKLISQPAIKKFAKSFMRKGNINLVNDVIKSIHNSDYKIDQVVI